MFHLFAIGLSCSIFQEKIFVDTVELEHLSDAHANATFNHQINKSMAVNSDNPCVHGFQVFQGVRVRTHSQ